MRRLEWRTRACQWLERAGFMAFCLAIGFIFVAFAFPQLRQLKRMEAKLEETKQLELTTRHERDDFRTEHEALRSDLTYLELRARDRLGYYRRGERVLIPADSR